MSKKLTTERIVWYIKNDATPGEYEWEVAIESAVNNGDTGTEDAIDAADFLEAFRPGQEWTAEEYHGLMYHHFTGRWESAAHIAHIRLGEKLDDMREKYADNKLELERAEAFYGRRMSSDSDAVAWLYGKPSTYVHPCPDGTVLTFDGIFGGTITEESPV